MVLPRQQPRHHFSSLPFPLHAPRGEPGEVGRNTRSNFLYRAASSLRPTPLVQPALADACRFAIDHLCEGVRGAFPRTLSKLRAFDDGRVI